MAYRQLSRDVFMRRYEESKARRTGGTTEYWKPQSGNETTPKRNVIRIMPPHGNMDAEDIFVESKMHWLPSKEFNQKTGRPVMIGVACLTQYDEDCPACKKAEQFFREAKAEGNEDNPEAVAQLKRQASDLVAKTRFFANIVDMDNPNKGVQIYAFGPDVEQKLLACFLDDDLQFRDLTHPKEGRDIIMLVQKKPKTDFNEYTIRAKESASKLIDMEWLDQLHDLTEIVRRPSREEVLAGLRGERLQKDSKGSGRAAPSTRPKPEPESESEPEAKVAEPTRGRGRPKKEKEEVQEEAPRSRRQAMSTAPADPWAAARAAAKTALFTPVEPPPNYDDLKKPPCYTKDTDPSDKVCQECAGYLPCFTAKNAA